MPAIFLIGEYEFVINYMFYSDIYLMINPLKESLEEYDDFDETENSEDEEDFEDDDLAYKTNYKADGSGKDLKKDSSNIDEGFFKYYDKYYSRWDLRRALLDNFTELRQKYDSKKFKYKDFEFVLENEYKADRSQVTFKS